MNKSIRESIKALEETRTDIYSEASNAELTSYDLRALEEIATDIAKLKAKMDRLSPFGA